LVTWRRQPILCLERSRKVLREVIEEIRYERSFAICAWVLLPDHIHCIWDLPKGDTDYSMRWGWIKKEFTKRIKPSVGAAHPTFSRVRHREGGVWQRRFWEHRIRDEEDFTIHCDYIHFNPVKHGLVSAPRNWPYSTFYRYVKSGVYPTSWGDRIPDFPEGIGGE
jgi:putative transposase